MKRVTEQNCLQTNFPEIAKEWHPIKNGNLTPKDVFKHSGKKVWWICKKCKHEWSATVNKRSGAGRNCPSCAGQVVTEQNCLQTNFPEVAKEWHPTKNGTLTPKDVTKSGRKQIWWQCSKCKHEWFAYICNRTTGKNGCPKCCGQVVTEQNCLQTNFPEIAKEWHPTKNGNLTSKDVIKGSNKKIWWKCDICNHEWKARIVSRTSRKNGCPKCSKKSHISKACTKWLDELHIPIENREYLIIINNKRFYTDGYNPETKTIYEYFGNFWHGNPEKFNPNDINPYNKKTFGELYKNTINRITIFKNNGYNVVYKWGF